MEESRYVKVERRLDSNPTTNTRHFHSHHRRQLRIHLVPLLDFRRSLRFDAIYASSTQRSEVHRPFRDWPLRRQRPRLAFKSKVVSCAHAEIRVEKTGSRPFQLKDGDILQLGVDYQGGAEDISNLARRLGWR